VHENITARHHQRRVFLCQTLVRSQVQMPRLLSIHHFCLLQSRLSVESQTSGVAMVARRSRRRRRPSLAQRFVFARCLLVLPALLCWKFFAGTTELYTFLLAYCCCTASAQCRCCYGNYGPAAPPSIKYVLG